LNFPTLAVCGRFELFVTPILLERVAHMELCKLNRNSELMYVQAGLPMDMARGLRGLSRRLVTKEQKIATVEGPWWLSCQLHVKGELNAHNLNETVTVAKKIIQLRQN